MDFFAPAFLTREPAVASNNKKKSNTTNALVGYGHDNRSTTRRALPGPGGDRWVSDSWHHLPSQLNFIRLEDGNNSDSSRSSNSSSSDSWRSRQRQNDINRLNRDWDRIQPSRSLRTIRDTPAWGSVRGSRHVSNNRNDGYGRSGIRLNNPLVPQQNSNSTSSCSDQANAYTTLELVKRLVKLKEPVLLPPTFIDFSNRFPEVQCPLSWTWNLTCLFRPADVIRERQERISELKDSAKEAMQYLMDELVMCIEHSKMADYEQALTFVSMAEVVVQKQSFFLPYLEGVHHVLDGCKLALTYASQGNVDRVIDDYSNLLEKDKSFVLMLHGMLLSTYKVDKVKSILYLRQAIELDATNPYWWYTLGKHLGGLRRSENRYSLPSEEEMSSLLFAVENSSIASAFTHLAEANRAAYFANKDMFHCSTAYKLYKKGLELNSNCPYVNIRCARGLSSLPLPYMDLRLAQECAERALEKAPRNPLVNHYGGLFYLAGLRDLGRARYYFEKAVELGNFPAHMSLLSLISTSETNEGLDIKMELTKMLQHYREDDEKVTLLCHRGYYSCLEEHQMSKAIEDWVAALQILPGSPLFKRIKPVGTRSVINLLEVMKEQIEKALQRTFGPQRRDSLLRALELIAEVEAQHPD